MDKKINEYISPFFVKENVILSNLDIIILI